MGKKDTNLVKNLFQMGVINAEDLSQQSSNFIWTPIFLHKHPHLYCGTVQKLNLGGVLSHSQVPKKRLEQTIRKLEQRHKQSPNPTQFNNLKDARREYTVRYINI